MRLPSAGIAVCGLLVAAAVPAAGVAVLRDSEGTLIGQYAEQSRSITGGTIVHSATGFRFAIDGGSAELRPVDVDVSGGSYSTELGYGNVSCAGTAFVAVSNANLAGGIVFPAANGYYYVPKAPTAAVVLVGSVRVGSNCMPVTPNAQLAVPALANDPAVTGVPNAIFIPPIQLEVVPLSQFLGNFRDGFESADLRSIDLRVEHTA